MKCIPKGTKVVLYVPYYKTGMGECTVSDIPVYLDINKEDEENALTYPIQEIRNYLGATNGRSCIALYFDKHNNYLHMKDIKDTDEAFCMWIDKRTMI